jgi:hypothetical protein
LGGDRQFALRPGIPTQFKDERLPFSTDGLVDCLSKRINFDDRALNAGLRKSLKITRKTIDDIFGKTDETVDSIQARLSDADIARRAQGVLFDANYFDPRDLHSHLLARLRAEYNEHQGIGLTEPELERALNLILATFPRLVPEASRVCAADFKQLVDAAVLPPFMEAPDYVSRSRLNVYGVIPPDLNATERSFAEMLDADTSNTVSWWHRNESRKPHSVSIVLANGERYFPDFIVGVNQRLHGGGVLLVETKGGHILNSDKTQDKSKAEHKHYGKPLMLAQHADGRFWIMRYIAANDKIEPDQVFRIENMGQY